MRQFIASIKSEIYKIYLPTVVSSNLVLGKTELQMVITIRF